MFSNTKEIKPNAEMRVIAAGILSGTNIVISGDPGEGKTAKIESACKLSGYHSETLVTSTREPQDFLGYPTANDEEGVMEYYPLRWAVELNKHKKSVAIFDEFSLDADAFKATLQTFAERRVGDLQLGKNVTCLAIMNPVEVSVGGLDMPAPVSNRFIHVDWNFDSNEWLANIMTNFEHQEPVSLEDMTGINPSSRDSIRGRSYVHGFIQKSQHLLNPKAPRDPEKASKPWPSPRSWTYLANILGCLRPDDHEAIYIAACGAVGKAAATSFATYMRDLDLIDPIEAMNSPKSVDFDNERIDIVLTLLSAVEANVISDSLRWWKPALNLLVRCSKSKRRDIAVPAAEKILNHQPKGQKIPAAFRTSLMPLLSRAGMVAEAESEEEDVA